MQIYAHRAGRGLGPENTLEACQILSTLAIDTVDFDVGMTKDGILVVTHDSTLNPDITRDSQGCFITIPHPVFELKYSALASYNVGKINSSSPYASFFPDQKQLDIARIPTLEEAIERVKSMRENKISFQIEIKLDPMQPKLTASPEQFAHALYYLLKKCQTLHCTEVQSFDYRPLLALKKIDSAVATSFLSFPLGKKVQKKLWHGGYSTHQFAQCELKMIQSLGGSCWCPFQRDLTKKKLEKAQDLGLKVVAWGYPEMEGTEFDPALILKLREWGIDGVITDRPDKLIDLLTT